MKRTFLSACIFLCALNFLSAQWANQATNTSRPFYALEMLSPTVGYAGSSGQLFRTSNGGVTWLDVRATGVDSILLTGNRYYDIDFLSPSTGWGVGWNFWSNTSVIYFTTNGGISWSLQYQGGTCTLLGSCYLNAIDFATPSIGVAVGTDGTIVRTTNSGITWTPVASGVNDEFFDVTFADANTGYIVGEGAVFKTVNGGLSWAPAGNPSYFCYAVDFIHPDTGMLAAGGGRVYVTHDGGTNWRESINLEQNDLFGITMIDADTAYACGEDFVYKTVSGGTHWQAQLSSGTGWHTDIEFPAPGIGIAVGDSGWVVTTLSGGDPVTYADAGAVDFLLPDPAACPIDVPLKVQIRNYGFDTLFSANIQWSDSGVVQPTYTFSGAIPPGEFSDTLFIDTLTWSRDPHPIQVWTSVPNAQTDQDQTNDTLSLVYTPSIMQGTYTIGGTNPDYPTVSGFVTDLIARGVCGHVVADIRPGTYTENITIYSIPYVDANNTVTFRAENGVTGSVILTGGNGDHILEVWSAEQLSFEHLVFEETQFASNLVVLRGSYYVTFSQCVFECPFALPYTPMVQFLSGTSTGGGGHLLWEENEFREGGIGIDLRGGLSGNPFFEDITLRNNVFTGQKWIAIEADRGRGLVIEGNQITSDTSNFNIGIALNNMDSTLILQHNQVFATAGRSLIMQNCAGDSVNRSVIANNFFATQTDVDRSTFEFLSSNYVDIVHNAFFVQTNVTFPNNGAMYLARPDYSFINPIRNLRIMNNLFVNDGGNFAFHSASNDASELRQIGEMDHNCFYVVNDPVPNTLFWVSGGQPSLSQWTSWYQHDSNSVNIDPQFFAWNDLHIQNPQLSGLATYLAGFPIDIDSTQRDSLNREMGADELSLSILVLEQQRPTCPGAMDGELRVEAVAGDPPYSYFWPHNNSIDSIQTGLSAGTYTVIVTDNGGDQDTLDLTLIDPSALSVSLQQTAVVLCNGDSTATLTAIPQGGTPPYSFSWAHNPLLSDSLAVNLPAGSYSVTVMDSFLCDTLTASYAVSAPSPLSAITGFICDTVNCQHTMSVAVSGGTPQYYINWAHDGTSGPIATNLCDSVYTINIWDVNGCDLTLVDTLDCASVGFSPLASLPNLKIYPNPASEEVLIELPYGKRSKANIRLIGPNGQVIHEVRTQKAQVHWYLTDLAKGNYYLEVRQANQWWGKVLIIQ